MCTSLEHDPDYQLGRLTKYAELVRDMRALQNRFFKGDKSSRTLRMAKEAEMDVDRATDAILNPPEPTMFGNMRPSRMPYRSECHCVCHSGGEAMHIVPCCQPDPGDFSFGGGR